MISPYVSQQPVDDFGLTFASLKYSATLAATTDTLFTVPSSAPRFKALIKVSAEVWVALNAVAAVPAGAAFAASSSEMVTAYYSLCREVKGGDVFHFFSPGAADVSIVLYGLSTTN